MEIIHKTKKTLKISTIDELIPYFELDYILKNSKDIDYVSKLLPNIPLLNPYTKKIEFIIKSKLYKYITQKNYRFPKKLNGFNLDLLYENFKSRIIDNLFNDITYCANVSFYKNLNKSPYYAKKLLTNYAKNIYINFDEIKNNELCTKIQSINFSKKIILQNAEYIRRKDGIHIVRFYSLNGDLYMNKYLRNLSKRQKKNVLLENSISILWSLIRNAPKFTNDHYVFRFLDSAHHLEHLNEGDIYETNSFMSTTRDPFYNNDEYDFGDIVLKIKIPKNKKGVGLLIELYSTFMNEEEFLISPRTKLRLIKKNWKYHHWNKNIERINKTTYYFELIDIQPINFPDLYIPYKKIPNLELCNLRLKGLNVHEKTIDFDNYTPINQFTYLIDNKTYHFITRFYDSSDVYSKYYYFETTTGFSISLQNPKNGQICTIIEINEKSIHVNYRLLIFENDDCDLISDENLILLLEVLLKLFKIRKYIIHSPTVSCYSMKKNTSDMELNYEYRTNKYNTDIYNYLKNKTIRFGGKLKTNISKLDDLWYIKIPEILKTDDLYKRYNNGDNMADFYIYIIETDCINLNKIIDMVNNYLIKNDFNLSILKDITYTNIPI